MMEYEFPRNVAVLTEDEYTIRVQRGLKLSVGKMILLLRGDAGPMFILGTGGSYSEGINVQPTLWNDAILDLANLTATVQGIGDDVDALNDTAVIGPASATSGNLMVYGDATGQLAAVGPALATDSTGNTVAYRTGAGDLQWRWGYCVYLSMSHGVMQRDTDTRFISSTDGFLRFNNAEGMQKSLGVYNHVNNIQEIRLSASAGVTLTLSDAGKIIEMNNAGANTVTIPTNASVAFPVGAWLEVVQVGAGTTTIAASAGVGLNNVTAGSGDLTARWGRVKLYKRSTNQWVVSGDVGAVA